MNLVTFRVSHPEFNGVSDSMVQSYLDKATNRIGADIWGALTDQGIEYLAAHLLATTPFGMNARLSQGDGTSNYGNEYKRLQLIVSSGFRVC